MILCFRCGNVFELSTAKEKNKADLYKDDVLCDECAEKHEKSEFVGPKNSMGMKATQVRLAPSSFNEGKWFVFSQTCTLEGVIDGDFIHATIYEEAYKAFLTTVDKYNN